MKMKFASYPGRIEWLRGNNHAMLAACNHLRNTGWTDGTIVPVLGHPDASDGDRLAFAGPSGEHYNAYIDRVAGHWEVFVIYSDRGTLKFAGERALLWETPSDASGVQVAMLIRNVVEIHEAGPEDD